MMIDDFIDCQTTLIAALDRREADAILAAADALATAVETLKRCPKTAAADRLHYGLKQSEAARIRVKYLTAWNRQKFDRLAKLRGQTPGNIYAKPHEIAK
jgi:hypothetical protein